ncbi:MAG: hypothetical protein ACREAB_03030 [Blastocatellia bacterium]
MHSTTYEEIVRRIPLLTADEQLSLIDIIRQQQSRNPSKSATPENGARSAVKRVPVRGFEAERAWLEANREQYRGQWVALKDGQLILSDADGKRFSDLLAQSGVEAPFISYIETEAEEKYIGGWQ